MEQMPQNHTDEKDNDLLIERIGHLTRMLRDGMHELGLDKTIQEAAQAIPDARDRLRYVAHMTEQAATTVLAATEVAQPIQDDLSIQAKALTQKLQDRVNQADPDPVDIELAQFLQQAQAGSEKTNSLLMEIMMAQGFQDLTGQVIMKMMDLVSVIERELVEVLLESIPPARREEAAASLLNGPQVNPNKPDVVSDQDQVDDLLSSLGF